LSNHEKLYTPFQGKTYSLFAEGDDSEHYYAETKRLADVFLQRCPDEKRLLGLIQKVGERPFLLGLKITGAERSAGVALRTASFAWGVPSSRNTASTPIFL
jgi:hypothetical protein